MIRKTRELFHRLLGKQSARSATVITTALTFASKALGYVRTLLVAYFFGATAFVDAYYVTFGAVTFLTGTIQGTVESAVMPKLVQHDEGTARDLLGWVVRMLIIVLGIATALLLIFPGQYVRIFASTFDEERLMHAGLMVKWVLPYALAMLGIYILSIWGNYKERFAIYATILVFSNVISIPSLLILRPIIGRYALPAFQSLSFSFLALCMWYTLRDMPLRPRHKVPAALLKRTCLDMFYCLAGSGAGFIYSLVDRYFASSLPAGNVSAISYAQLIYDQPVSFVAPIMSIYLVRASAEVKDSKENGDEQLFTTMFMAWSYFFPIGVIIAILSAPLVKLLLGYGAFDAKAIAETAPCLMMLVVALPVKLWNSIVGRYGQALGKQRLFAIWSYIGLVGNYFLDAAFVKPYGATGLCAATTMMLGLSTLFFVVMLAPRTIIKLAKNIVLQSVIVVAWSMPLYFVSLHGLILPLLTGAVIFILHILLCERFGLFEKIPQQWRPLQLMSAFSNKLHK